MFLLSPKRNIPPGYSFRGSPVPDPTSHLYFLEILSFHIANGCHKFNIRRSQRVDCKDNKAGKNVRSTIPTTWTKDVKWEWQIRVPSQRTAGKVKSVTMGAEAHSCWEPLGTCPKEAHSCLVATLSAGLRLSKQVSPGRSLMALIFPSRLASSYLSLPSIPWLFTSWPPLISRGQQTKWNHPGAQSTGLRTVLKACEHT